MQAPSEAFRDALQQLLGTGSAQAVILLTLQQILATESEKRISADIFLERLKKRS